MYVYAYLDVSTIIESEDKQKRVSRRALRIEEKLKNKSVTSLFDTDGDLSKHNIIEGSRRTRKRLASEEDTSNNSKRKKQMTESRVLIKNAQDKLLAKPKTELDKLRNEAITKRQNEIKHVLNKHENKVKELYHLEMFQNMLDFDPKVNLANDLIYQKVFKKKPPPRSTIIEN